MCLFLFFRLDADSQDKRSKARLGIAILIFFILHPTWLSKECMENRYFCVSMCSYFVELYNRLPRMYFQKSFLVRTLIASQSFIQVLDFSWNYLWANTVKKILHETQDRKCNPLRFLLVFNKLHTFEALVWPGQEISNWNPFTPLKSK